MNTLEELKDLRKINCNLQIHVKNENSYFELILDNEGNSFKILKINSGKTFGFICKEDSTDNYFLGAESFAHEFNYLETALNAIKILMITSLKFNKKDLLSSIVEHENSILQIKNIINLMEKLSRLQ